MDDVSVEARDRDHAVNKHLGALHPMSDFHEEIPHLDFLGT
jgi:hypothetical protein